LQKAIHQSPTSVRANGKGVLPGLRRAKKYQAKAYCSAVKACTSKQSLHKEIMAYASGGAAILAAAGKMLAFPGALRKS
jgi:hypothetical protein